MQGDGEVVGETKWYQVNAFGGFGDYCRKILQKGDVVSLRGFYKGRSYTHQSGEERVSHDITLNGKEARLKVLQKSVLSENSFREEEMTQEDQTN